MRNKIVQLFTPDDIKNEYKFAIIAYPNDVYDDLWVVRNYHDFPNVRENTFNIIGELYGW
jgi:hypothetical protein